MVHKKYTYKKGKKFGPYYYETKRVDGKVVTTYLGKSPKRVTRRSYNVFYSIGIILFLLLIFFAISQFSLTGKATLDVKADYEVGEPITGNLKLNLKSGELIPANSMIKVRLGNITKEIELSDLVDPEVGFSLGQFYVENLDIIGSGRGYGVIGEIPDFPDISFDLLIYNTEDIPEETNIIGPEFEGEADSENQSEAGEDVIEDAEGNTTVVGGIGNETQENGGVDSVNESASEETDNNESGEAIEDLPPETIDEGDEEIIEQSGEEIQVDAESEVSNENDEESIADEPVDSDVEEIGGFLTGAVVSDLQDILSGKVRKDKDFEYNLDLDKRVKLVKASVKIDGEVIDSDNLNVKVENGKLTVSTDYSYKGFGEDYLGKNAMNLNIDLSDFELVAQGSSDLVVTLFHGKDVLVEVEKDISVIEESVDEGNETEDITLLPNQTLANISVSTFQFGAKLGEPVKWVTNVSVDGPARVKIAIPASAGNVSIVSEKKVDKNIDLKKEDKTIVSGEKADKEDVEGDELESENVIEEESEVNDSQEVLDEFPNEDTVRDDELGEQAFQEGVESDVVGESEIISGEEPGEGKIGEINEGAPVEVEQIIEEAQEINIDINGNVISLTGRVSADIELDKESGLVKWLRELFKFTGFAVGNFSVGNESLGEIREILVEVNSSGGGVVDIEYYTDAPNVGFEENLENGKRIGITSPDDVHYENVLLFTNLSEELGIKKSSSIQIYWEENSSYLTPLNVLDSDFNGIYDYVEWVAPRLSNQTFSIIVITKAEHLDSNRIFIKDIFEEVRTLDGNWSETIPNGDYVRVKFEIPLDSSKDITVYPRTVNGTPKIEVYEIDGNDLIAEFESLTDNEYNKVLLDGSSGAGLGDRNQDTFDLRILNGGLEFDHIVDPVTQRFFEDCEDIGEWTITAKWQSTSETPEDPKFCQAARPSGDNMTTNLSIDLSEHASANLSFYWQVDNLDSGEYFKVYANSSTEEFIEVFSFISGSSNADSSGWENVSLEKNITLDAFVHIRASCLGPGFGESCQWDTINISSLDDTAPDVVIIFPTNTTYNSPPLNFNVSLTENGSVQYSLDAGINNVTMTVNTTGNGFTVSNTSISDGTYTFQVYANDTLGNVNYSESTVFSVDDTVPPGIEFTDPTTANGTRQLNSDIFVNVSTSDANKHYAFTDFDRGLVLWMRMDDANSTGVIDLSTYSNNGTFQGEAFINSTGYFGNGTHFDGENDYILVPDSTELSITGNITVSAWVKLVEIRTDQHGMVMKRGLQSIDTYDLVIDDASSNPVFQFVVDTGSAAIAQSNQHGLNEWFHVVGTYNGTAVAVYVNGVIEDATAQTGIMADTSSNLGIGSSITFNREVNGSMDEVLIWNRSLSEIEILALYNATADKYEHNFTGLGTGVHTFVGHAVDLEGNKNSTLTRTVKVNSAPTNPTPDLNSTDHTNLTTVNLNIFDTLDDAEGDTLNVTVVWYKENKVHLYAEFNNTYADDTEFIGKLASGNTTKGQNWTAGMRVDDGLSYSDWVNASQTIKILNTPPDSPSLSSPAHWASETDRAPTFSWSFLGPDTDGDTVTYDLNLTCYALAGGVCSGKGGDDARLITGLSGSSHELVGDLLYLMDSNNYYNWTIRTNDGEDTSAWPVARSLNITSLIQISVPNSTVIFNEIAQGGTNDTTDNFPPPFLIQNDGNAISNITIKGTNLWVTQSNPNRFYQFKADNYTVENNSFNYPTSTTEFTNMFAEDKPETFLVELNYTNATDTAEVDINISVPVDEEYGLKESTVTFTASLAE